MKLVLIDRDGVINREIPNFVKSVAELDILPEALEAFALFKRHNFTCAIVTNQSVVGRGIISDEQLERIHNHLREKVKAHGGEIADIFACTDSPDKPTYRRKPKPGMLIEALEKYNAKSSTTPYIGDAMTDLEAAHGAGCNRFLVMTGKGKETMAAIPAHLQPVTICTDILDAARRIVTLPNHASSV